MPKGDYLAEFEIYVMLAVLRLGSNAYGVTIRREIEERSGRPVSIGAVYATLGRLEEKKLVGFQVGDPQPVQGGRSRKLVSLTPEGLAALEHSTAMLQRMMDGTALTQEG
ncbi:MAG: PadR family transcriptional regulator [Longimicrobiales bacterium]